MKKNDNQAEIFQQALQQDMDRLNKLLPQIRRALNVSNEVEAFEKTLKTKENDDIRWWVACEIGKGVVSNEQWVMPQEAIFKMINHLQNDHLKNLQAKFKGIEQKLKAFVKKNTEVLYNTFFANDAFSKMVQTLLPIIIKDQDASKLINSLKVGEAFRTLTWFAYNLLIYTCEQPWMQKTPVTRLVKKYAHLTRNNITRDYQKKSKTAIKQMEALYKKKKEAWYKQSQLVIANKLSGN